MAPWSQNGRQKDFGKVWIIFVTVVSARGIVLAQNSCVSDDNCQLNEFCNLDQGSCQSCLECSEYNRNGTYANCPKSVTRDCGGCMPGFVESFKNHMDTDVKVGDEVCQADGLVAAQMTTKASNDQPPGTVGSTAGNNSSTSTTVRMVANKTVLVFSDAHPTDQGLNDSSTWDSNSTVLGYDESDTTRPWIYVGISVTFLILCGTFGVVGFKVYLLPRQLKQKAELRKLRSIERAEKNTRKTKEDMASASKEETECLYPDRGQDSTPVILRSYLNKPVHVRETSH